MKRQGIPNWWEGTFAHRLLTGKKRWMQQRRRGIIALLVILAVAVSATIFSRTVTHASSAQFGDRGFQAAVTINQLNKATVVGSTAFIVDGHGRTISADANPYGIAIVSTGTPLSRTPGALRTGDIIVTNFGGKETGTTLVRFPGGKGPAQLFNTTPSAATNGPAFESINSLSGTDWVANFSGKNVQVFNPNGIVLDTITNPLFKGPWGMAFNQGTRNRADGSVDSFFVSDANNATIDRIAVIPTNKGTTFRIYQIGQLTNVNGGSKVNITWTPSLQIGRQHYVDVLLALDPATNRVAAYPNSTTVNTTNTLSTNKGITVFQGKPLNMPGGLTINPLNGDLLVVNLNDNNLVELNLTRGRAVGVRQLDTVPVDQQSGNGSALFGVAATRDARGNLEVFFTDDNTNTLNVLSV